MPVEMSEISEKAYGGTELMSRFLTDRLPPELLEKFQIIPSRVRKLDPDRVRIFYAHDLPSDPESEFLKNRGWEKLHRLVFVSHWQQQAYLGHFGIPASKSVVIQNCIDPIDVLGRIERPDEKVRLIYHTTPHRGLNILVPVFAKLMEDPELKDKAHLDVYSSFQIYGWGDRDKEFEPLFKQVREHPNMTYHGTVSNPVVREALGKSDIFAYPSIWPETSCISLMEAMSAGLICVHPNYAALPETSANLTWMYQWHEDQNGHAQTFYLMLKEAIKAVLSQDPGVEEKSRMVKGYADLFYGKDFRLQQWINFLMSIENEPTAIPTSPGFVYRTC